MCHSNMDAANGVFLDARWSDATMDVQTTKTAKNVTGLTNILHRYIFSICSVQVDGGESMFVCYIKYLNYKQFQWYTFVFVYMFVYVYVYAHVHVYVHAFVYVYGCNYIHVKLLLYIYNLRYEVA